LELLLEVTAGVYVDTSSLTVYIGQRDVLVWDPDLNHTSGPVIADILDSLDFSVDYSVQFPEDLVSVYRSIFICCGVYPNNFVIRDTSRAASALVCYLEAQNGKVYLEGGDIWVGDPQANHGYNFCPLFEVEPISNTIGLFPGTFGQPGTFTQDMEFEYLGEVTMLDCIDSTASSSLIFRNAHNNYGCAVAANNRTVGTVFELGCLVDTISPSTKYALLDSIMDYFGIPPTGIHVDNSHTTTLPMTLSIHPNPCRRQTTIGYSPGDQLDAGLTITIYDVAGRLIRQWDKKASGSDRIVWQGTDQHGRTVPDGVYFVCLCAPDGESNIPELTRKIILLK
jgi:hypothetical protein